MAPVLFFLYSLFSPPLLLAQPTEDRPLDVDLTRREAALSEMVEAQLNDVLGRYYKKGTYISHANVYLERVSTTQIKEKTLGKGVEGGRDLPGLPIAPPGLDRRPFSNDFRISFLELTFLLDDRVFHDEDVGFIKSVAKTRINFDPNRGDILGVTSIPFPPTLESLEAKNIPRDEATEIVSGLPADIRPSGSYLYWGGITLGTLLFAIIVLQAVTLYKTPRSAQRVFSPADTKLQILPRREAGALPIPEPGHPSFPVAGKEVDMPRLSEQETAQDKKDMFNELRQLILTTVVGNPELAGSVFKNWVDLDKEGGIYKVAGMLKATDSRLIELLSEYLGQDIVSKVEFALGQIDFTTIDRGSIAETFKKFREEFQKEQYLKAAKMAGGAKSDIFHFLKQIDSDQLFRIIKDEPVGVVAIVLAQLQPELANLVLQNFPIESRLRIPIEMGKLKKVPISAYEEIANKLAQKALEAEKFRSVTTDGIGALINLLEQASPQVEQQLLTTIAEQDIALASELRKVYITFDELPRLPDRVLADVLRDTDRDIVMKSLVNVQEEVKEKILNLLPSRMKLMVSDGLTTLNEGEVPIEEINKARQVLTQKIRDLARSGRIDLRKFLT